MQLIDTVKTHRDVFVAFCTRLTEQIHCFYSQGFDVSSTTGSLTILARSALESVRGN